MDASEVSYRLEDRVAIITGVSSGLGCWLAKGLDRAGARLVSTARRPDPVQALAEGLRNAIAAPGDITNDLDRARVVEDTHAKFGRIDALVNNAATNLARAADETAEDLRRLLDVRVGGPFDLARRCLAHMRAAGGGSVVNITSVSAIVATGLTVPGAGNCASKAAVAHLTRELAVQWGRYDIRVNAVAPGTFPTEMTGQQDPPLWASRVSVTCQSRAAGHSAERSTEAVGRLRLAFQRGSY
jgi:NAD(P)-dependent dehydrogenase (short-subunit alcohol dehydrogenase family)